MKYKISEKEFELAFSRSSGAGGQNVNKLNTRVTLTWPMRESEALPEEVKARLAQKYPRIVTNSGEVQITSQKFRTQARNIADCIGKLHSMIEEVERPPKKRRATKPSRGSVERRLKEKKVHSDKKRNRREPF